ncbi:hypothetical protein ACIBFB_24655 [Nocardiopsis sp. NPDC050513]|uniref:hypothetical protein n=1 Tax=Nocardiopsis sp. NPDC050513 TaxID=3364338 RepID=UPI0037AD97CF
MTAEPIEPGEPERRVKDLAGMLADHGLTLVPTAYLEELEELADSARHEQVMEDIRAGREETESLDELVARGEW